MALGLLIHSKWRVGLALKFSLSTEDRKLLMCKYND